MGNSDSYLFWSDLFIRSGYRDVRAADHQDVGGAAGPRHDLQHDRPLRQVAKLESAEKMHRAEDDWHVQSPHS